MNLFIKSARIIDPTSADHLKQRDIIIENGKIADIGNKLSNPKNYREVKSNSLCVSPGWVDMFAFLGDPGFEHKEDIESGIRAAAAGGFTTVCCMPNTYPPIDSKSQVEYVLSKSKGNVVNIYPIGTVSKKGEGEDIAELYDMKQAGAIAFSDGIDSSMSAGLMLRGLLYVKPFNGLVISHPDDHSLRNGGLVNEGKTSTILGMPGIPAISEEVMVMRDIYLAEYAGSRVHFAYVSSAESLEMIRKAKSRGVQVTCSVSPYNLILDDSETESYDTNYKVLPPLKSEKERKALIKALKDGTIDSISSMHIPQDTESKKVEFDYAEFGMIGLETAYAVANTASKGNISAEDIVKSLSLNPRKILGLAEVKIEKGAKADLTLFDDKTEWILDESAIKSRSKNSPFVGSKFTGKVLGVVHNNKLVLN